MLRVDRRAEELGADHLREESMASFTEQQIEQALEAKAQRLDQYDIRRISEAKQAVMKMIEEFPESWSKAQRQATLLFDMIEAAATGKLNVHPDELKYAAGALIYLGDPLDIVPDEDEDGYADDAAVVGLAVAKSEAQVRSFCTSRGLNAAEYVD
jgi:uncharacterized membrane protein YkvA (DUF1232 family)